MATQILLADDHGIVRQGLRLLLQREGFEVVGEAVNGQEAVRLATTSAGTGWRRFLTGRSRRSGGSSIPRYPPWRTPICEWASGCGSPAGPMTDVEGILVRTKPNRGVLVVSVDLLRRSVAVQVDCTAVTPA